MRCRNWVFTLNNPEGQLTPELDFVVSAVSFLCWQLEVGEEGTPHFQGYVELDRPCSLLQMQRIGDGCLFGAHFDVSLFFAPFLFGSAAEACLVGSGRTYVRLRAVHRRVA
jgi:hypothetical protein